MDIAWIFMFLADLILPLTMIILGRVYSRKPPKNISRVSGYRTSMSMKNADTWEFAHRYFGKLSFVVGLILLPVSIMPMLTVLNADANTVGLMGGVICALQAVPLFLIIIATEKALYKNFDKYGMRK